MIVDARELCVVDLKGRCRVLCIDYGDRRVGMAISDINWVIASPLVVLGSRTAIHGIAGIVTERDVGVIVIGAPLALNGGEAGKQLEKVRHFVTKLDETIGEINITMWDERLSTHGAMRVIENAELKRKKQKKYIDKVAASFILQGFLEYCS